MSIASALIDRLRGRVHRESNADMNDELRFHLEMEAAALERSGMTPDDARHEARRRFGGVDHYGEELRDLRGARWLERIAQDTRYALRVARRFPAFTAIVVLTLGLAIGASTAVFSVVDAVLLRPMPVPHPEQLAILYAETPDHTIPRFGVSWADYVDWRRQTRSFADIAAYGSTSLTLVANDSPERVAGLSVTPNYFRTFGVHAVAGRLFDPNETDGADADAVVIGEGFFKRHFGGDTSIIGKPIQFGARARVVLGVVQSEVDFGRPSTDVFVELTPRTAMDPEQHGQHVLETIARLRPGVSIDQANHDLKSVAARLADQYQDIKGWGANAFLARDELALGLEQPLLVLLAAAIFVLLIGCINVANLLITRGTARAREVALRQAIGASRARLVSQLLVENCLLALLGGLFGLGLASLGVRAIVRFVPAGLIPQRDSIGLDARVLGFALALSLVTALLVGLWPALRTTTARLGTTLRDGGRGSAGGAHASRLRRVLVVAEISLALVLLVCASLVLQSLQHTLGVDPGFRPERVVAMRLTLGDRASDTAAVAFYRDLTARLAARGGIESAAAVNTPPMSGGGIANTIRALERAGTTGDPVSLMCDVTAITPGYFKTLNMPMLRGHDIAWTDARAKLIVSAEAAKRFWPGENPIGKRLAFSDRDTVGLEVVGVVADARTRSFVRDPGPVVYVAYRAAVNVARTMTLVVRGPGTPASIAATTRAALREIDPTMPVYDVRTLREIVDQSVAQPRFDTALLSLFATMALILATIGIYGVVSYSVAQRRQEIGVRIALGAQSSDVMRIVLGEGAALATTGVAIGLIGALFATPLIRSWLYGIGAADPITFVVVALVLIGVATLASFVPARRATRVDPLIAMRAE